MKWIALSLILIVLSGCKVKSSPTVAAVVTPPGSVIPLDALNPTRTLGDMVIGEASCVFVGYRVDSSGAVWLDLTSQIRKEGLPKCGPELQALVVKTPNGYAVTVYGKQDVFTISQGMIRAEKVTYVPE